MREKLKDLLFLLLLGIISSSLLLGLRGYTLPLIQENRERKLKAAVLDAGGISFSMENLKKVFEKKVRTKSVNGITYYLNSQGDYIFQFEGRGLWGIIRGVITLAPDLKTIKKVRIISQEETPGLGGRITEEEFLKQFEGKRIDPILSLALRRKARKENEIEAITGATITSQALLKIINEQVKIFREKLKGKIHETG